MADWANDPALADWPGPVKYIPSPDLAVAKFGWPGVAQYQAWMYRPDPPVFVPTALLIIDMQNDFCGPNGSLAVQGGRELGTGINEVLNEGYFVLKIATRDFHPADHISFATQHPGAEPFTSTYTITSPENPQEKQTTTLWPPHCVQGTEGCELIHELDVWRLTHIIDKGQDKRVESYSGFGPPFENPAVSMSGLADLLNEHGIQKVEIVGLALDYCVKHTAIDAAKLGFETHVLMNLTQAVDQSKENMAAVHRELTDHGVIPLLVRTKAVTDEDVPGIDQYWAEIEAMGKLALHESVSQHE
ncbi:hypothetical protein LTR85_003525 [Meristemomyces frigidus]|nr:hypothetical protein LTR85_003525 [Meristemomyces frigidus]